VALVLRLKLITKPGQLLGGAADVYYVTQANGEYVLRNHALGSKRFGSLTKLAHTLGGIVAWDRWSGDAQLQLEHLNLKGAF
jgi:hypothetical protein